MNTRLGCLSGTGLIATLLAVFLVGGVTLARGGVLFSPGSLNAQAGGRNLGGVQSHAEITRCAGCHPAIWEGEKLSDRCLDCHHDEAEQIQTRAGLHGLMQGEEKVDCRRCHTDHRGASASLHRPRVMHAYPHEESGFSLAAHEQKSNRTQITCSDCHTESLAQFDPVTCAGCHTKLDAAYLQAHMDTFGEDCLACHDGLDTYGSGFDHQQALFPLEGEHAKVVCAGCHSGARSASDLKLTSRLCIDCHLEDDAHAGDFGKACGSCHTPESWQGASFDHSLSAFPLTGAHTQLTCRECHVEGPSGVVYKGTPTECAGCHADPEFHAGMFGGDCTTCHTTQAWSPAGYDRSHTFPLDHGESGISSCRTCHAGNLQAYTCYGCHAHDPAGIESKHLEEGIRDFADCTRCHPTGREEEGERGGED